MEVVLGVVVLSHAAIFGTDAFFKRRDAVQASAAPPQAPVSTRATSEAQTQVQQLEARLASLNAEARAVNSPDTFVQYARLKREAIAVEKELVALRGENETSPSLPMLDLLSSMMPTPNVSRTVRTRTIRSVLGFLPLVLLWAYFRFVSDERGQAVIVSDCDVFRPFAFFFSKVPQECDALGACSAHDMCAVSYRMMAFVASAVVGRAFAALKGVL